MPTPAESSEHLEYLQGAPSGSHLICNKFVGFLTWHTTVGHPLKWSALMIGLAMTGMSLECHTLADRFSSAYFTILQWLMFL